MDTFHPIDDTHGPGCPARFGLGFCDEVTVRYSTVWPCSLCGKIDGSLTVLIDDKDVGVCPECWSAPNA